MALVQLLRRNGRTRVAELLLVAVVVLALTAGQALSPHRARAREAVGPVQVGVSFSQRRAASQGLDYRETYRQLLAMHFKVVRLGVYWDDVAGHGWGDTDWLVSESEAAGQPVLLTIGMKSLGWPEFFLPDAVTPRVPDGGDVSADPVLADSALAFVGAAASRYAASPAVVAWQVENEPFNRAGPHRWWIAPSFLQREVAAVRMLSPKPVVLNTFGHFDMRLDQASSRNGVSLAGLLGFDAQSAERDALDCLQPGDVLGVDVYTRIGYTFLGGRQVATASADWTDRLDHWSSTAAAERKRLWVTEAQAEPWEPDSTTAAAPISFSPADMLATFDALRDNGDQTVLLWGAEYWFARAQAGDTRWLDNANLILRGEAKAPPIGDSL